MSLTITASPDKSVDYVRIRGEVDLSDSRGLSLAAQRLITANAGLVFVDLAGITFMGSTLAGFLVHVANSGRTRKLVLCRPTPMALRVLQMTGLDKLASVRSDLPLWPDNAGDGDSVDGTTNTRRSWGPRELA